MSQLCRRDLRIENADNPAYTGSSAQVVYLHNVNDNIVRKNIVRSPNRYGNNGALHVAGNRNLIEDNDILRFHRNGIEIFRPATENNKIRRNYVGQTLGWLGSRRGPNDGYVCYDSRHNDWENNIFEGGGSGGGEGFSCWGSGNKFYGNISLNAAGNAMSLVANASVTVQAAGYVVRDQVSVGMHQTGLYARSPINVDVQGLTAHTSVTPNRGLAANDQDNVPATSLVVRNLLAINTTGVVASPMDALAISHSQQFGSSSSWGTGTAGRISSPPNPPGNVDPIMGVCRTHLPEDSPFKGRGYGGADVGANALFEYVNGLRTTNRMFDSAPTGADRGKLLYGPVVIAGVNDSSTGNVRSTVHQRLGFGIGMCQFPANYGGGTVPKPPDNMTVSPAAGE
jgi:hypothetical protein